MVETAETTRFAELTDNSRQCLKELDRLAQSLIREGVYASAEEFLRDNVRQLARHQIAAWQAVIRGFEKKYISWEKFSDATLDTATIPQEDEWMEWESARRMLAAWQKALKELG